MAGIRRGCERRAVAGVGASWTRASVPGDPGPIPRAGGKRRGRRTSLQPSICAGKPGSTASSSTVAAEMEEVGERKGGEHGKQLSGERVGGRPGVV